MHLRKRNRILCNGEQESWEWQANSVHCPARVSDELVQSEKTWKTPPCTWGLCPKQETAFLWAREINKKLSSFLPISFFSYILSHSWPGLEAIAFPPLSHSLMKSDRICTWESAYRDLRQSNTKDYVIAWSCFAVYGKRSYRKSDQPLTEPARSPFRKYFPSNM